MIGRLAGLFAPGALGLVTQIEDRVYLVGLRGQLLDPHVIRVGDKGRAILRDRRLKLVAAVRWVIGLTRGIVDMPGRNRAHISYTGHVAGLLFRQACRRGCLQHLLGLFVWLWVIALAVGIDIRAEHTMR